MNRGGAIRYGCCSGVATVRVRHWASITVVLILTVENGVGSKLGSGFWLDDHDAGGEWSCGDDTDRVTPWAYIKTVVRLGLPHSSHTFVQVNTRSNMVRQTCVSL